MIMGSSLKMLMSFLLCLFFLQLDVAFSSSFSSSVPQLCSHEEAAALLQFKSSFSIEEYSTLESWKEGIDCCSWVGVSCDNLTGHVIGLDLSFSQLSGLFPSNNTLFLLKYLQSLDLSYNVFEGSKIPSEIGELSNLKFLDLCNSGFSGPVPGEISHLSMLVSLNLSYNGQLIVEPNTLRNLVHNLSQVRELVLTEVNMSSVDPRLFINLSTSLTTLSLDETDLRGNFSIIHFPNLKRFSLSGNFYNPSLLTIDLPSSNWSSNLQYMVLSDLQRVGGYPESMTNLKSLETLTLTSCKLEGSIPSSLLNLPKLNHLDLSFNSLSGPIPVVQPNRLSKLSFLRLRANSLNGTIPPWIFTLPRLRSLILSYNQLEGQLSQLQSISLENLDLSNNRVHGSVPSSISNQVNLSRLDLSSNNFSGILEFDMFSNLQNLISLGLSNNSMSFRNGINANFTLPSLEVLHLSGCGLSQFPNFIRETTNLVYLDLSNNKIEGRIPEWMWDIGKDTLQILKLSDNSLSGALQKLPWKVIQFLYLQSNKFQGGLPIPPNGTQFFQVSDNYFDGQVSSEICNVDTFVILDLSRNNFSGKVPECLLHKSSKNLRVLNLQANKFHGAIPSEFPEGCRLQNLNLQGNQMEGPFPRSLVNCGELEVLDVDNNKIKDSFPYWLESLSDLQVLVLRSNRFHGYVSSINNNKTNSSFPKLRVLDLSDNDFVGPLPTRYIENFKAMVDTGNSLSYMQGNYSYHFSMVMNLKGHYVQMEKILTIFTSIDLSKNKFVGEIPDAIGRLHSLKGLNLSHNNLGGHIPRSLGKLTNIESLDMSSNELVGKIPEELAYLTQLAIFNLSNNQLDGRIPQGNQFNTFRIDSYQGNVRLCGHPLSKNCGGNGTTDQPRAALFEEKDEFWEFITWRVVGIGFGCGTLFGLLMGYLIFKIGRPKWFASTFDLYPYLRGRKMNRAKRRIQGRN